MNLRPVLALCLLLCSTLPAAEPADPLKMVFHRRAVRRFVFDNNLTLTDLNPRTIVRRDLMHPDLAPPANACEIAIREGRLHLSPGAASPSESAIYVGGVNPYGTYELDLQELAPGQGAELGIELATLDRATRVLVVARYPADKDGVVLRLVKDGKLVRERVLHAGPAPAAPCILRIQLAGVAVSAFATREGQTVYLGHTTPKELFGDVIDFRDRRTAASSTFNIYAKLAPDARIVLNRAGSCLSAGVGQADIRPVTHRDGAPYIEDNRLWFTFSARGLNIADSYQAVMSLDPSTFAPRLEGAIVHDRGDGLLRNDYASHLFYDDEAQEWRMMSSCFSVDRNERGPSGLAVATSKRDPRRGFSVMKSRQLTAIPDKHEDPCIFYDTDARKWRLLTTPLKGFRAQLYESDHWDGPFTLVAGPVGHDSTGTLIQKIGERRYIFSGSKENAVFVYSYPDLRELGTLKMDLPPFDAKSHARVWPNVFPLPPGYPARYMALMMDRPNFPDVRGGNWSYGALYLYEAYTPDLTDEAAEFPLRDDQRRLRGAIPGSGR